MSLGQSLNISTGALRNNQYALTVVSHNVANLNTAGYTRKRVNFEESIIGNYGRDVYSRIKSLNGSTITGLVDYMDEAALGDIAKTKSDSEYYNTLNDAIGGLEDMADALGDDGLNGLLNEFFKASANLEQFPDDLTIRQQYVAAAQSVCDKFNEISKKYDDYQDTMISDTQDNTETVNRLLEQIAASNENYIKNGKDSSALNDTYALIQELSSYVNVTTEKNANGTLNVCIGNVQVVKGSKVNYTLQSEADTSGNGDVLKFSLKSTEDENQVITKGINEAITGGKIGASIEFLNGTNDSYYNIADMKNALNEAANAFATELNKIQTYDDGDVFAANITTVNGVNQLEKSTVNMFVSKDGQAFSASNITVNSEILNNVFLVAAARIDMNKFDVDKQDWKLAVGNSTNATEITALQTKKICDYGGKQDNCTLSDFLSAISAKNALDKDSMDGKAGTYKDLLDSALTNYSNLTGVNIDEEISDLLKYQRAYEASAKVFSTVNGLYDTILGMI